ncbi:hypothetical protein [Brachybacterium sp.]|uniref:hypothetical protein n=1 Tax=Brachybacterium sp. TaxID=1891286 RepID=UPI002ED0AFD0
MSITDSRIRASVWAGSEDWRDQGRRWYVDVYYAARRSPATPAILRAELDADPDTEVIRRDFATRGEALDYARFTVGLMRRTAAIAIAVSAGMVTTEQALAALGNVTTPNPEPLEAP